MPVHRAPTGIRGLTVLDVNTRCWLSTITASIWFRNRWMWIPSKRKKKEEPNNRFKNLWITKQQQIFEKLCLYILFFSVYNKCGLGGRIPDPTVLLPLYFKHILLEGSLEPKTIGCSVNTKLAIACWHKSKMLHECIGVTLCRTSKQSSYVHFSRSFSYSTTSITRFSSWRCFLIRKRGNKVVLNLGKRKRLLRHIAELLF